MTWSTKSKQERGYGGNWEKVIRPAILRRDGYMCQCPECKSTGRILLANQVDHIIQKADGGTDDPSNLRAVNKDCHKRLTTIAQGKTPKPKRTIGKNGWPV